jgi:hydroxyethylthiazole kinase-like uncharacterized protein yjeF
METGQSMTELLTSAQMRAIEAAAIASGRVTGLELMERAGTGAVEAIFSEWPELRTGPRRAVVLCGPGNNGGDGFVMARLLLALGWQVEVFFHGAAGRLPPDAQVNYKLWSGMGTVQSMTPGPARDDATRQADIVQQADVVIDAVFGIGLNRAVAPLSPMLGLFHTHIKDQFWPTGRVNAPRIVSIDVPTGLCADSGQHFVTPGDEEGTRFAAHLTVTFHRPKIGHYLDRGPRYSNALRVVDIGLNGAARKDDPSQFHNQDGSCFLASAPTDDCLLREQLRKDADGHKYRHGHALIVAGGPGRGGAARLAALAALRVGAGLVTLACPPDALAENAARLDAVMLASVGSAGELVGALGDTRINALCLGPGMGLGARQGAMIGVALARARSVVLDADALTLIARDKGLFAALHAACVLTPHGGEFARLFPDIAAELAAEPTDGLAFSKVDAVRQAAARAGSVVLLKGADTVIADPSGRCAINAAVYDRAAPWLATAGAGDVLAGMIAGLLARGLPPFEAACTGAWLHVDCARRFGPGLIAEDLPDALPGVFRALGL